MCRDGGRRDVLDDDGLHAREIEPAQERVDLQRARFAELEEELDDRRAEFTELAWEFVGAGLVFVAVLAREELNAACGQRLEQRLEFTVLSRGLKRSAYDPA